MGTWSSSKIREAKQEWPCFSERTRRPHGIAKGERYLDYALGQRNKIRVCLDCALTKRTAESGGQCLEYDCQAVQDELARRDDAIRSELAGQSSPI